MTACAFHAGGDCGRNAVVLRRFVGSSGDQAGLQRVRPVGTSHEQRHVRVHGGWHRNAYEKAPAKLG